MLWLIKFAMCAMLPRSDALPGIADTDLDGFLRRMRRECEPLYWLGLVVGGLLFSLTPIVTVWLPLPAFFLPRKLLERHTDRVLSHPIYLLRQAVYLVRLSAGMCWGADPVVRKYYGLAPYGRDAGTFRQT